MRITLEDKVAVVTGAGSGIGAAAARALAAAGAMVALIDRDADAVTREARASERARPFVADVSDRVAVQAAFAEIATALGGIDVLVNNAGVESVWTIERMPESDWDRVLAVNLKAAMLCTQAAVLPMRSRGGGAIVNVASVAGRRISYSGGAAYTASKAGVLGFTRHAAFELGRDRIRVNAVCPGPTLTPMILRNTDATQRDRIAASVPLGRWVMPDDVAQAILFLASESASMCTGTALDVDGGVLVSNGASYEDYFARRR